MERLGIKRVDVVPLLLVLMEDPNKTPKSLYKTPFLTLFMKTNKHHVVRYSTTYGRGHWGVLSEWGNLTVGELSLLRT